MEMNSVKRNSAKAWFLAARPKTLTGAAVPVIVGVAAAYKDFASAGYYGLSFGWVAALLCLLFAFIMQIDANLINDFYDYVKETDREDRLGPERACAQGWVSLGAMKHAIALTTVMGCLVGLPLIYYGGLEMIGVGLACVVFCFLYTTCLSYMGLGDVLVLVFFGLVPVCTTYYIQLHTITIGVVMLSIAVGLATDCLLIVNNFRDIEQDKKSGKNTLITKIGKKAALWLYLGCGLAAAGLAFVAQIVNGRVGVASALLLVYVAIHIICLKRMKTIGEGKELNKVLGMTAMSILVFGIATGIAILSTVNS